MIFFTSDHHFGHERVIDLCNRPFSSIDEMNSAMVERWNHVVGPTDVVFHLGDLAMGKFADSIKLTEQLNGVRFLVPGNHDRVFAGQPAAYRDKWLHAYQDAGWIVLPQQVDIAGTLLLCHFPYSGDSQSEDRYASRRPVDVGHLLLHGHTHSNSAASNGPGWQYHVGVDAHNFAPVSWDQIQLATGVRYGGVLGQGILKYAEYKNFQTRDGRIQ